MAAYDKLNRLWPENVPALAPLEAIALVKRLYRFAMKKPFHGKFKVATGNRMTWVRNGTFNVNASRRNVFDTEAGWKDVVHLVSHYCHAKLHPTWKQHGSSHAALEQEMVEHIIAKGWLDGSLKPRVKVAPAKPDVNYTRVLQGIARWTTKAKRAETALRKLRRKQRYYERQHERSTTQSPV